MAAVILIDLFSSLLVVVVVHDIIDVLVMIMSLHKLCIVSRQLSCKKYFESCIIV